MEIDLSLPPKLIPVFTGQADVRGAYGGRGSGKTMSFAKMTAVRAYMWDQAGREGVIVCGREYLNSIDDSSLAEVKAAIESEPWLREHFEIGEKYIRTTSRRIAYKFSGLDERTIMSLKSKAKILLLWADEAEPITDKAWDIVIPTLRQEDSELWVTWNPARKGSATDKRFRQTKDPRIKVVEMNWRDNPRFPTILERLRKRWQDHDPDSYEHVWEGAYATAIKGAYFVKHLAAARREGRVCKLAHDPNMKRRLFVDIGGTGRNADAFSMWGGQFVGREVRILHYYEQVGQDVAAHLAWMREHGYEPKGTVIFLPHDGATHDKVFNVSYQSAFEAAGYSVEVVPNQGRGAAIARINAARRMFPSVWFNEATTGPGLEALGWYHEKWDEDRDIGLGPEHDWASHSCLVAGSLVDTDKGLVPIEQVKVSSMVMTPAGLARVTQAGPVKVAKELIVIKLSDGRALTMTPEHKVFTTRGVVCADALEYNDSVFTVESLPWIKLESANKIGYRAAFSEYFAASDIGSGRSAVSTCHKRAGASGCFTEKHLVGAVVRLCRWMEIGKTSIHQTGVAASRALKEMCRQFMSGKSSMACATTGSHGTVTTLADTRQPNTCTGPCGQTPTEPSAMGSMFTTSTVTRATTDSKTSALWQGRIMQRCTPEKAVGLAATQISGNYSQSKAKLRNGTEAPQGESGTKHMALLLGKSASFTRKLVRNVAQAMKQLGRTSRVTAVGIVVKERVTASEVVYDLTVEKHHCYFANGFLVSNSDAFGLMAVVAEDAMRPGMGIRRDQPAWKQRRRSGMAV